MFHTIKSVTPLLDYKLQVEFKEGITKTYDTKSLFDKIDSFKYFIQNEDAFLNVKVDTGGYGIVWNEDIDLSCDELWLNGEIVDN